MKKCKLWTNKEKCLVPGKCTNTHPGNATKGTIYEEAHGGLRTKSPKKLHFALKCVTFAKVMPTDPEYAAQPPTTRKSPKLVVCPA